MSLKKSERSLQVFFYFHEAISVGFSGHYCTKTLHEYINCNCKGAPHMYIKPKTAAHQILSKLI